MAKENWVSTVIRRNLANMVKDTLKTDAAKREGLTNPTMFIDVAVREKLKDLTTPLLTHIRTHDDYVSIQDRQLGKRGRLVAVYFCKNGAPYCDYCEETDCIHVQYAWEIPDAMVALDGFGLTPPPSKI